MEQSSKFGSLIADGLANARGLTLGLVAHPSPSADPAATMTLSQLSGTFALTLIPASVTRPAAAALAASWRPRWSVWTSDGSIVTADASTACVHAGVGSIIKGTYNATSRRAMLFVNNVKVAVSPPSTPVDGVTDHGSATLATAADHPPIFVGAESAAAATGFHGALEEISLKNISTEAGVAYVYTDNVRPDPAQRVYLFDLNRESGRRYFATSMSKVLNAHGANFDTTQVSHTASSSARLDRCSQFAWMRISLYTC